MKKFLKQIALFFSILLIFVVVGTFTPPTPRASQSLLFGKIIKDSLLKNIQSPRYIFIAGSNLSFGLDSKTIQDSLFVNPINTGIQGSIGLFYMMRTVLEHIRSNDTVIIAAEYDQYFGDFAYGSEPLYRTILDVVPNDVGKLDGKQLWGLLQYTPKYAFSKLKFNEYLGYSDPGIYGVKSFNNYGDAYLHWTMETISLTAQTKFEGPFNNSVIDSIVIFRDNLTKIGATMFITYPAYDEGSYKNMKSEIAVVDSVLKLNNLTILGDVQKYVFTDSMIFEAAYHLTKSGVDRRTKLFIEDVSQYRK